MRILTLADIHIGSIKDTNYVFNVVTDILDKELKFNKTDAVIILGDLFHQLMKANSEYASLAINIISHLVRLCKGKNIKIRMIYGTEGHESNQYKLFSYHLNETDVDMKIINTVTVEELFPNINVLYIPEEYVEDKKSYYEEYLSDKHYKYIFGHGVIVEGMPMLQFDTSSKSNEKKIPYFKSKEISTKCDLSVWGHYHCFSVIEDNLFYLGSLFRDSFGEEEPKGYGIIENDKLTFIENKEAYIYKTYTYDENSDIYKDNNNLINEIKRIKEENEDIFNNERTGKIRLIFNLPTDVDSSLKDRIRSILVNDKKIQLLIKESAEISMEDDDEVINEYSFILDSSLGITEKIHRYINKVFSIDMSLEEIENYINGIFN